MPQSFRYAWPSSGIDADLMRRLYLARESSHTPTTITELVAQAIRAQFGHLGNRPEPPSEPKMEKPLRPAA